MEIETDSETMLPDSVHGDSFFWRGKKPWKRFAVHPNCRPRVRSTVTAWYVLKDWNTESYLRLPNASKGESGDGLLVDDIKTCTVFSSADAASRVAMQIESLFWKPVYAKMNLHVCPLKDELPKL